jgi:hypothetical protein
MFQRIDDAAVEAPYTLIRLGRFVGIRRRDWTTPESWSIRVALRVATKYSSHIAAVDTVSFRESL